MQIFKKALFYTISFTWGVLMSVIGLIVIFVSLPFKRVHFFHSRVYAEWGQHWGGVSLGCFFVCDKNSSKTLKLHECGHGIQNCIWGPLMLFVIFIPSATRYWYRELRYNRKGLTPPTQYDDIWFEKQATKWGNMLEVIWQQKY